MLYRLEIENFRSIRDRQVIDLTVARNAPDLPERFAPIHPGAADRAPKVVVLFGANAAGKSTVLSALYFIAWFIRDSFGIAPDGRLPFEPFNDDVSQSRETRFRVEIAGPFSPSFNGTEAAGPSCRYSYDVRFDNKVGSLPSVAYEGLWLRHPDTGKSRRVFERWNDKTIKGGEWFSLSGYHHVIDKVRANASLVSTLAQFDHGASLFLRQVTQLVIGNMMAYGKWEPPTEDAVKLYAQRPALVELLNREIGRIDLGIRRLEIVPDARGPIAMFEHQGLKWPLPLFFQSHGTKTFLSIFPWISDALTLGGIALIDELDLSIHSLILPEIIRWFHDPDRNPHDAQLWMTCQNASLLEDLVKEEVFLCEKDDQGRTSIYGAKDIQGLRRTDSLYRKYLGGVLGGVPRLG